MRWRARPVVTFSMIALLFLALVAVVLVASRESADTTATSQESAVLRTPAGAVSMDVALVADKIKGGWVGQMAGSHHARISCSSLDAADDQRRFRPG
jgi:hypothetical protein